MPRKDRDVWEPPEDRNAMEEPPSAFMQHFQDRAVRVGKDGSNAQLVRAKQTKPIRWSDDSNKKNEDGNLMSAPVGGYKANMHNKKTMMMRLPSKNRRHAGGIVAPDELKAISPVPRLHDINLNSCLGGDSSAGRQPKRSLAAPDVDCRGVHGVPVPVIELSPHTRPDNHRETAAATAVVPPHSQLSNALSLSTGRSQSLEVLSVERGDASVPVRVLPISLALPNTLGLVQVGNNLRKPLPRLLPRRISGSADEVEAVMMPRSKNKLASPLSYTQNNSVGYNNLSYNRGSSNDVVAQIDGGTDFSGQLGDARSELTASGSVVTPMYQPMGLMVFARPSHVKNRNKRSNNAVKKQQSAGGAKRPVTEEGLRGSCQELLRPTRGNNRLASEDRESPMYAPTTGMRNLSYPSRLQPLAFPLAQSADAASATGIGALTETKESELEEGKKKAPSYKAYKLKDYKVMMEQVANLKLGGLGPADTDEQRQAKEKLQRQRQYGELAEKQAVKKIREKHQQWILLQKQQLEQQGEEGAIAGETPSKRQQQPPPSERIQAQERRTRALDYARNLPRPAPPTKRKAHDENSSSFSESGSMRWHSPLDEAACRREQRLKELEARHRSDRQRVEAVKRQLGY
ncbi:putative ADG2 [Trypanosoma rangeli]|uniref:Putative ADG2 n=1 Tax=Trypanosoma rangeli TaxID=5698 RepID=A0A422NTS3_TRYRA|nr:putative ADG2 [Trypanosoma rangeli]RNF08860.1 putative ADG2 [Trypanosoma rangeli]|eukprot:RNF08860.1 putative ADG2 [Trypanosoma rangeli]